MAMEALAAFMRGEEAARKEAEKDEQVGYRKGDRCRILGDYKVEHYDCDEWGDGVITDVRTGRRVER
ncbi:hypothetical protein SEA_ROMAN_114 [Microbacterium phage Roman]|nr:hypothetical protein SEA_ROMAN_114 [Microbacterium phage Roman]